MGAKYSGLSLLTSIRAAREASGITQAQLADAMGSTQTTVSQIECGHRLPTFATLMIMADRVGLRIVAVPKKVGVQ